jgi:TIR domain
MADIFISYAKSDRPLALKLAAMLEAEGWSTWWDTSLTIGDDFRNEIMTELGRARAVIVIWTDASIKSDWVRSEAGRAQADRKLIPVKLPHLTYKDLPPPFDVLHTENIGEEDKIKAAVVAQLAKPAVEPTPWALLGKGLKWELLSWWGIIGGALTLFTGISATLKVADWARILVDHWREWTHAFWAWAFGWLGFHLPPDWTLILSFLLFGSFLAVGHANRYKDRSFKLISWRTLFCIISMPVIFSVTEYFYHFFIRPLLPEQLPPVFYLIWTMLVFLPVTMVVIFARQRLYAAVTTLLIMIFFVIITYANLLGMIGRAGSIDDFIASSIAALVMLWILPIILLSVAPAKAISRRLIFLALGLLLLIAERTLETRP